MVKRNWQKLCDADSELGELKSAEENMGKFMAILTEYMEKGKKKAT